MYLANHADPRSVNNHPPFGHAQGALDYENVVGEREPRALSVQRQQPLTHRAAQQVSFCQWTVTGVLLAANAHDEFGLVKKKQKQKT